MSDTMLTICECCRKLCLRRYISYQVVFIGVVWRVSKYGMGLLQDTMISLAIWMFRYYQRTAYDFQDLTPDLQQVPYLSSDEGVENHDFLRLSMDTNKDNITDSATVATTRLLIQGCAPVMMVKDTLTCDTTVRGTKVHKKSLSTI